MTLAHTIHLDLAEITRQAVEEITTSFVENDFSGKVDADISATGNIRLTATGFWIELKDGSNGNLFWVSPSYPDDSATGEALAVVVDEDEIATW